MNGHGQIFDERGTSPRARERSAEDCVKVASMGKDHRADMSPPTKRPHADDFCVNDPDTMGTGRLICVGACKAPHKKGATGIKIDPVGLIKAKNADHDIVTAKLEFGYISTVASLIRGYITDITVDRDALERLTPAAEELSTLAPTTTGIASENLLARLQKIGLQGADCHESLKLNTAPDLQYNGNRHSLKFV
ncbi:hypothetical protein K3495_g2850 [Podosphaera aphanis]|nr:hypothetical protein K3495_g2850 [Podosphaera aphanis]